MAMSVGQFDFEHRPLLEGVPVAGDEAALMAVDVRQGACTSGSFRKKGRGECDLSRVDVNVAAISSLSSNGHAACSIPRREAT